LSGLRKQLIAWITPVLVSQNFSKRKPLRGHTLVT